MKSLETEKKHKAIKEALKGIGSTSNILQRMTEWYANHPCSEREAWMIQNFLGSVFGEEVIYEQARKEWERKRTSGACPHCKAWECTCE